MVAVYFGHEWEKANSDRDRAEESLLVKSAIIGAMKRAAESNEELHREMIEISNAESMEELNNLYNRAIGPK